jgi:probable phosphoglycerate mutase
VRLAVPPIAAIYWPDGYTQTAEAVAAHHDLPVLPLPGVIEADYGDWTGGKIAELAKTDLWRTVQRAPSRARFPSGESLAEMQTRMVTALEMVVAEHAGEMIVVSMPTDQAASLDGCTDLANGSSSRRPRSPCSSCRCADLRC